VNVIVRRRISEVRAMPSKPITHIRVDGTRAMPKPGLVLVAGQLVAGDFGGRIVARSTSMGDAWAVIEVLVGGVRVPNAYDLRQDGKRNLLFTPLGRWRRIEVGEEFMEVAEP
jgi:hypothetical protein